MSQLKIFEYTWQMFSDDSKKLALFIKQQKFDRLIGVASGGLPLLTKLYNTTKLPYELVKCSSYDGQIKKAINIEFGVPFIEGKKILIVDDISDTGETLAKVVERCEEISLEGIIICTATLCMKPHTKFSPHWCSRIIGNDYWINFPWE